MAVITREETTDSVLETAAPFLRYLSDWDASRGVKALPELIREAGGPANVAIHVVDVLVGFCDTGRLASPRIAAIVPPITALLRRAYELGIRNFLLEQDAHPQDSPEFEDYGPHCVEGTAEAETVPELLALPFANEFVRIPKRSINPAIGTELDAWLGAHPKIMRHIVVGDCTDICVYQTAMHLKARGNAFGLEYQVVVPEECVQTYDVPVETAEEIGVMAHGGDFLHLVFLYHMALNGVCIVKALW